MLKTKWCVPLYISVGEEREQDGYLFCTTSHGRTPSDHDWYLASTDLCSFGGEEFEWDCSEAKCLGLVEE